MTGAIEPEVIEAGDSLARLAPDWWALWRRCPAATPFTSPAWLLPWWDAFAPGALRTVALRQGGRLVALAPLWLEEGPLGRRLLPLGIGLSDLFDVLLDPAVEAAPAALASAVAAMPGWDNWELEELPADAAALSLPVPAGCRDGLREQSARVVLALKREDDPLACLPAAKRRKLRMAQHRVARRAGRVEPVGPGETSSFLADLIRLHGARWAARDEAGVLADSRVGHFHALALPRLVEAGLARLSRLDIDGRVVGAYYGLRHGPAAYAYLGGFDPDYAFESPGAVLIGEAIAEAGRTGATTFDFLRGREPYKYGWGAVDRLNLHRSFARAGHG